jgi:uncharacterized protein YndB with AHSA1/START domain
MSDNLFVTNRFASDPSDRILRKEILVSASLEDVWHAWTTNEGAQTFFSSQTNIKLYLGGPYEIYFILDNPPGLRGSEDCHILSYLPQSMLAFEWNAPPDFGPLRGINTQVVLQFERINQNETKVILSHLGWGKGEQWDKIYDYFDRAWGFVLGNLKKRFTDGPLDWNAE